MEWAVNMSTIKEIASRTKLSVGTVSLVLNGRGDEMRISKKTQQLILEAAQGMGYIPNIAARRLRQSNMNNNPTIAIFWPYDLSADLLGRFFIGAQSSILEQEFDFELTLQPYSRDRIEKIKEICSKGIYHAAVLTGLSSAEQNYLEENPLGIPTVLFNRSSEVYSCVYVDTYEIGRKTAELFMSRGHKKVGTITPDYLLNSDNNLRLHGFVEACEQYGLELNEQHIQVAPMTMEGGNIAASKIIENGTALPSAIYFPLGLMAVAALPQFHRAGVKIPDQMEVLTYGDSEAEKYSVPSLSTVKLPVEEMSTACIRLALGIIHDNSINSKSIVFETPFIFRDSCGGFKHEI